MRFSVLPQSPLFSATDIPRAAIPLNGNENPRYSVSETRDLIDFYVTPGPVRPSADQISFIRIADQVRHVNRSSSSNQNRGTAFTFGRLAGSAP